MEGSYQLAPDGANGILAITLRGLWSAASLTAFAHDVDLAVKSLPCGAGRHRVVVDCTAWPVQSQAVFGAMMEYLRTAEPKAVRTALLCAPGLARFQFRRAIDPSYMAMFDTEIAARAWLDVAA